MQQNVQVTSKVDWSWYYLRQCCSEWHTRGHCCTFLFIWRTQNGVMLSVSVTLAEKWGQPEFRCHRRTQALTGWNYNIAAWFSSPGYKDWAAGLAMVEVCGWLRWNIPWQSRHPLFSEQVHRWCHHLLQPRPASVPPVCCQLYLRDSIIT